MRYVLDTNIAIAALNRHPDVLRQLATVPGHEIGLPLVAIGELTFGALRSGRTAANLAKIRAMRARFAVLPVTENIIDRYAAVRAELVTQGIAKSDFDLVIACTAIEYGAVLVTHDAGLKDGKIADLLVEDWLPKTPG